ncbi:MAG TPA: formylglycine-generating enzyme family protein, partial [Isosphaeraceae bacterium]|nr:formylglycine-generating enzyme family protein [Isosphaeraceae bacterium]
DPRPTPAGVAADSGRPSVPGRAGSGDPRPTLAAGSGDPRPTVANAMDAILFHPETSIRRALILALGTFAADRLSPGERQPLADKLLDLYRDDPDAGVHGAAEWTLRQWRQQEKLKATQAELTKVKEWAGRRWYVNGQGQTFVIVEGPVEFRMGSPASEPDRDAREVPHRRVIPRRFAIADREVTVRQYQDFLERNPQIARLEIDKYSPDPAGPMNGMTWYEAAAYCNWLSEQEGLPKANWCYLPNAAGAYAEGMTIPANVLERTGYRLPTEAEWEYACRAGTMTSRYHGLSLGLLGFYVRFQANSKDHAWQGGSLLPNDLGLFDMLGNVYEWCQDPYGSYQPGKEGAVIDHITVHASVNEKNPRLLRGGAFNCPPAAVRSASRDGIAPSVRNSSFGFRPARTYP